jgi:vacuolar-type H+-ATPase subunit F/Vma7
LPHHPAIQAQKIKKASFLAGIFDNGNFFRYYLNADREILFKQCSFNFILNPKMVPPGLLVRSWKREINREWTGRYQKRRSNSMEKIFIMGDILTVTSFTLSGIEGMVADRENAVSRFRDLLGRQEAGVIMITQDLSDSLNDIIHEVNNSATKPLIIEIPGIEAPEEVRRSVLEYVTESLSITA